MTALLASQRVSQSCKNVKARPKMHEAGSFTSTSLKSYHAVLLAIMQYHWMILHDVCK